MALENLISVTFTLTEQIENRLQRLSGLTEQLNDIKVLLDHNNHQNKLTFYRNIKFMSKENVSGTTTLI